MQIGIGMPNTVPGTTGKTLIDWAKQADERGFSTLTTIGRIAYPGYEELLTLAAAAGATQRIGLLTDVLLAPTRDPVLLAKEAASLDQLSGGRFTLGIGVGGREDDYAAVERNFRDRGKRLDTDLELMHQAWAGQPVAGSPVAIGPAPVNGVGVPLLIGGNSDAAITRTVRWGVGWTSGGGGPQAAGAFGARIREAWQAAGKAGAPRIVALQYFALGADAPAQSAAYIADYYGFLGPWVQAITQGVATTGEMVRDYVQQYSEAGIDELIFGANIGDAAQVGLLADIVFADKQ